MASSQALAWFEREPGRLQWELEQFETSGLLAAVQYTQLTPGHPESVRIDTELDYKGARATVNVLFPHDYPDAPPMFCGPPGLLDRQHYGELGFHARHQYPGESSLCWSADPDRDWHPSLSAALIVANNIQALLDDSASGGTAVHAREADMPEPLSGFIKYGGGQIVVVPEPFFEHDLPASRGKLKLMREDHLLLMESAEGLGAVDPGLRRLFIPRGKQERDGFWVELAPPARAEVFNGLEPWDLTEVAPELFQRLDTNACSGKSPMVGGWLGVTFLEEGPARDQVRRNWAFGFVSYGATRGVTDVRWCPAQALTAAERRQRTPELVGLERAQLLVVGAGSLGAPVTLELAKAGVGHIDVVDPDDFDVNNCVRHTLPVTCAGRNKAEAVAEHASKLNPFVEVCAHDLTAQGAGADGALTRELIEAADVVVDTTGSNTAARVVQRLCIEAERPLIVAGLTAGSYGGVIRIARPGGACFDCFLLHEQSGDIRSAAAAAPSPLVTPVGCSHPAFAGAGFDATQLAAAIARTAVQVTELSGYPPTTTNWAVANFQSAPAWRSGHALPHPHCWRHV